VWIDASDARELRVVEPVGLEEQTLRVGEQVR
jgi:hypothetical protein